ncbi:MAG: integrase [Deltaproteobacteria bacterium RIFOXYA12_FULL_61_11]|nr:MAG: integrase [Deltaproteobacteria bacterium RIFOXYA12_FULL_61_11]
MSYAESTRTPRTLTDAEQARLLKVTGEHARGFRDHVLLSFALGTALREAELLALNVGDVFGVEGKARRRVQLRVFKRSNDDESMQEVVLPDPLRAKLEKLWRWKKQRGEGLEPDAPLFVSRRGLRLSSRQLRNLFHVWQERAGFERVLSFHSMRHSSLTNVYRSTRDIRLTQRVARHKSITSTIRYAGPSDEDILRAVRDLPC